MDSSQIIARHVAGLAFRDLPTSAVEATRRNLLDTVGVAIAGAAAPGCAAAVGAILGNDTGTQSAVWGTGRRASAAEAALANGMMAHALDFDDTHDLAVLHAGISVVPAALAMADRIGGVSGEELAVAVTAGLDLACRLGVATRVSPVVRGWAYTATHGLFGAAAAAARLLKLDAERIGHALGIAYAQAAGNCQCLVDGALTKRMQPGFAARNAVQSAIFAEAGITGTIHTFDGIHGLARVYLGGEFDRDVLLRDLGSRYEHENLGYKPYPACRHTHAAIDAALHLAKEHDIALDTIEAIAVGVNEEGYANVCIPAETKCRPRVVVDAQFSIPFCVATALARRRVFIPDLAPDALGDPAVLRLASLVRAHVDPRLQQEHGRGVSPAAVSIVLKNGTTLTAVREEALGGLGAPMDFDMLAAKFRQCAQHAWGPAAEARADALVEVFRGFESLPDVRALTSALG